MMFRPYPEAGRVVLARTATAWLADIEAYLVEQEMPTTLAPIVAGVIDVSGASLASVVAALRAALVAYR